MQMEGNMQQMPCSSGTLESFSPPSDLLLSCLNYVHSHKQLQQSGCLFLQASFAQRHFSLGWYSVTLPLNGVCSLTGMLQAPNYHRTSGAKNPALRPIVKDRHCWGKFRVKTWPVRECV